MSESGNGREGLRVVVVGATGNVGTSVVEALSADDGVASVTALSRREPRWSAPKATWVRADVRRDDLVRSLRGADVVVHLAWIFQPTHDPVATWRTNVVGSIRVFDAVVEAGVPALVHASSVAAYSPGPKEGAVDESWPTHGWPGAAYAREKAYLERYLDALESRQPQLRVVRLRPGFLFKRESAAEQRRLFVGPLLPHGLARPEWLPVLPDLAGLRVQTAHTADVAEAYRLAVRHEVSGAFNIAAEPVVDMGALAELFGARAVPMPVRSARWALAAMWKLRLVPASAELFDAVLRLPIMDTTRARTVLGWEPRYTSLEAVGEVVAGMKQGTGAPTPPLEPKVPGGRLHEVATGVGGRE